MERRIQGFGSIIGSVIFETLYWCGDRKHGPFHPTISYLSSFTRRKQYKILHCSNVNTFDNMADIVEILCEQIVPAILFTLLTKRLQNSPLKAPLRELYSCTNSQNKRFCYFFYTFFLTSTKKLLQQAIRENLPECYQKRLP